MKTLPSRYLRLPTPVLHLSRHLDLSRRPHLRYQILTHPTLETLSDCLLVTHLCSITLIPPGNRCRRRTSRRSPQHLRLRLLIRLRNLKSQPVRPSLLSPMLQSSVVVAGKMSHSSLETSRVRGRWPLFEWNRPLAILWLTCQENLQAHGQRWQRFGSQIFRVKPTT